jgi:outer membrane protein OmpA-like peptidoglycan-associated protein
MYEDQAYKKRLLGSDNTMSLFVSLYLILLAFFIILNSISNQATAKSSAAMDSVNNTFSNNNPAPATDVELQSDEVKSAPLDDLLTKIQGRFYAEFEIEGRFSNEGGKALQIRFPVNYLFERGSLSLDAARQSFLSEIVGDLNNVNAGEKLDVAFMFGTGGELISKDVTRSQEIAIRRAGTLARYLRDQGIRAGQFSTGFAAIEEDQIVAVFREAKEFRNTLKLKPVTNDIEEAE